MTTSTEQLSAAIAALQDAADAYNGKKVEIDDALALSQAGYNSLAANLAGVVGREMFFTGTVATDAIMPMGSTPGDGDTFASIADLISASPAGAYVVAYLMAGQVHAIPELIYLSGRTVLVAKMGTGANPVMAPGSSDLSDDNRVRGFAGPGRLFLNQVDVLMPAKVNAALPWAADTSLVRYGLGTSVEFGWRSGTMTSLAAEPMSIVSCNGGSTSIVSLSAVTLDGNIEAIGAGSAGSVMLSQYSVTLANGAVLFSQGTVGTNILKN